MTAMSTIATTTTIITEFCGRLINFINKQQQKSKKPEECESTLNGI